MSTRAGVRVASDVGGTFTDNVAYDEATVETALEELRALDLARRVKATGQRVVKHRHVVDERLGLAGPERAVFGVLLVAAILGVIIRFGLLAGMVAFFTHFWTFNMPITLSAAQPYFQTSLFALGLVAAMAIAGVWLARTPDFTIAARRP